MLLISVLGLVVWLDRTQAQQFRGTFYAIDGDSLMNRQQSLRLLGIDAPELMQICKKGGVDWTCGRSSRQALRRLIKGSDVLCSSHGIDRYDRWLVTCANTQGVINSIMVESGMAIGYGGYFEEEGRARRAKVGLWAGDFAEPQDWRRAHRSTTTEMRVHSDFRIIESRLRAYWWTVKHKLSMGNGG